MQTIVVPGSLPYVFAGLRIGLARAIGGIVSAEMTATVAGLGNLLIVYGKYIQPDRVFASLVSLGVLSIILTATLVVVQRRIMPWAQRERLL
jgi:NitT/TauT family transport system permease protein